MSDRTSTLTEAHFRGWIVATATGHGWLVHVNTESNEAFPNVILARAGALIVARVKAERANVTAAQQEWLDELGRAQGVEVVTWRPSMMNDVYQRLTKPALEAVS